MARKQHKNEILFYLICPILFFVGLLIGYGAQSPSQSQPSGEELLHTEENTFITQGGQVASRFSPTKKKTIPQGFKRNIIQQTVNWINHAKSTLCMGMFSLTHPSVIEALAQAATRGVKVFVIVNSSSAGGKNKLNLQKLVAAAGVEIYVYRGGRMDKYHHKYLVIDQKRVITGSANLSKNGDEKNRESNFFIDGDVALAGCFYKRWEEERDGKHEPNGHEFVLLS